jgi:hypothetical protein
MTPTRRVPSGADTNWRSLVLDLLLYEFKFRLRRVFLALRFSLAIFGANPEYWVQDIPIYPNIFQLSCFNF